jgi:hypothetical protein
MAAGYGNAMKKTEEMFQNSANNLKYDKFGHWSLL